MAIQASHPAVSNDAPPNGAADKPPSRRPAQRDGGWTASSAWWRSAKRLRHRLSSSDWQGWRSYTVWICLCWLNTAD